MDAAIVLRDHHGVAERTMLIFAGLAAILLPMIDLWPGLWPPAFLAPFFALIVLAALALGSVFVAAGVLGDSTELRVLPGGAMVLDRRNLLRHRRETLTARDVTGVRVVEHDWETRATTWSVRVTLARGKPVGSQDFDGRAGAEDLAETLRRAIGLP